MSRTKPVVAAFGDSLTQGWGIGRREAYPAVLAGLLSARGIAAEVRNFGVSGETAGDGLRRLPSVLAARPDVAVVAFGANDAFERLPPEKVAADLARILEALSQAGERCLLAGVRAPRELGRDYVQAFDALYPRLAGRLNVPLVPDILADCLADPDLLLPDGYHPNAMGARRIAEILLPHVLELLPRAAAR